MEEKGVISIAAVSHVQKQVSGIHPMFVKLLINATCQEESSTPTSCKKILFIFFQTVSGLCTGLQNT